MLAYSPCLKHILFYLISITGCSNAQAPPNASSVFFTAESPPNETPLLEQAVTVRLSGPGILPFTADIQKQLIDALYTAFQDDRPAQLVTFKYESYSLPLLPSLRHMHEVELAVEVDCVKSQFYYYTDHLKKYELVTLLLIHSTSTGKGIRSLTALKRITTTALLSICMLVFGCCTTYTHLSTTLPVQLARPPRPPPSPAQPLRSHSLSRLTGKQFFS